MIKDFKVKTYYNGQEYIEKDEYIVMTYDDVIQIPDIYIFNNIMRKEPLLYNEFNLDRFKSYDEMSIQPILFDRRTKDLLEWLAPESLKGKTSGIKDYIMKNHGDEIYQNAEFTKLSASVPLLINQKIVKKINIIVEEEYSKVQIQNIVKLYGNYAYMINVIIKKKDENVIDIILDKIPNFTTLFHNDVLIIKEFIDKGIDLKNKAFSIAKFSYNFEKDDETNFVYSKYGIHDKIFELGFGMTYFDVKDFSGNIRYFSIG